MTARRCRKAGAAALLALLASAAHAELTLRGRNVVLEIAAQGGLPARWEACAAACDAPGAARRVVVGPGAGFLAWRAADAGLEAALAGLTYTAEIIEAPGATVAVLTATTPVQGRVLSQRYELSRTTHQLRVRLQAPPGVRLALSAGAAFVPEPLPGFGVAFSDVEVVRVNGDGQQLVDAGDDVSRQVAVAAGEWFGVRQRFWAWLARPAGASVPGAETAAPNQPVLSWPMEQGTLDIAFYAGPVEWQALRAVSPDLTQMLFAALWAPLRWLCYGLLFLLAWIMRGVDSAGVAIVLLSLAVKIILWPLTRIADRWQQQVNRTQSRLQPRLDDIKSRFRGEEAHNLTLQAYRDAGVHPLFTLKSLAGFAIQVPMFIAAFDMLADNFALAGRSFLWIGDLAAPDRFLPLPFTVPFFGGHFNLLPALMTGLTVLSAVTQRDDSLTPALLRRQRLQLHLMAGAFFLLFYTFPAGMVLYWTANNGWHLLKVQAVQWWSRRG